MKAGQHISKELMPDIINQSDYSQRLNVVEALLDPKFDDNTAICFGDQKISYRSLRDNVNKVGTGLMERGIRESDKVILRLDNTPYFTTSWLALLGIGAVPVATTPLLKSKQLREIVRDCNPRAIITSKNLEDEVRKAYDGNPILTSNVDRWINSSNTSLREFQTEKDDVAIIAYTSGTTGKPKGTMHTHADVLAIADTYAKEVLRPSEEDVFGGHPNMAFTYGLGGLLVFPLRFGASSVLSHQRFDPQKTFEDIEKHEISILFTSPKAYRKMMNCNGDLSSLRTCVSAGEHLPKEIYEQWRDKFGVDIIDGIGSTELLHIFISGRQGEIKVGSTGRVVGGYEAKIVDDKGNDLGCDTEGLLAVRGPTGCKYFNRLEEQRQKVKNGWTLTGDVFAKDGEGYFCYNGRSDDMINMYGFNVFPTEVEEAMLTYSGIEEIAVVGAERESGKVIKAYVVPDGKVNREKLISHAKGKLSYYMVPKEIEFVGELPKTPTGKLARRKLG